MSGEPFLLGDVVWHSAPFTVPPKVRPFLVLSDSSHPFHGEENAVVGSTREDGPTAVELEASARDVGNPDGDTVIMYGCPYANMSKNIAISDDVYERLTREKGDQSFSEVIEARLDAGNRLADVTGQRLLDETAVDAARHDVARLSEGTLSRLDDEAR